MPRDLEPAQIGGVYGRPGALLQSSALPQFQPKNRALIFAIVVFGSLLVWAGIDHVLLGTGNAPWAFHLYANNQPRQPRAVRLPLLLDPVGILFIFTSLATPIFCAHQVTGISAVNSMIVRNIAHRTTSSDPTMSAPTFNELYIDGLAKLANRRFKRVGSKPLSFVILVVSAVSAYSLYKFIETNGLLRSWNPSALSGNAWRRVVYNGWWANAHLHISFAVALVLFGTFYVYHLIKQVLMGVIFAAYSQSAIKHGFGMAHDLHRDVDGHWGLRELRYFMQWTYVTTITDFTMTLGLLLVWLPFDQLTVFMEVLIIGSNILCVLYPTSIAVGGTLLEKKNYVQRIDNSSSFLSDKDKAVERVWSISNLPFKLRGTLGVVTIYALFPILLALISGLLGGK